LKFERVYDQCFKPWGYIAILGRYAGPEKNCISTSNWCKECFLLVDLEQLLPPENANSQEIQFLAAVPLFADNF